MDKELSPVAQAIKAKRQELIEKPLSRIYEELAEAAVQAYVKKRHAEIARKAMLLATAPALSETA